MSVLATRAAEELLRRILSDASGFDLQELDRRATFLELGFDSLFLIQFSQKIKTQLRVKVTIRQLIEELPTLEALIEHIAGTAPAEVLQAAARATPEASQATAAMRDDVQSSRSTGSAPVLQGDLNSAELDQCIQPTAESATESDFQSTPVAVPTAAVAPIRATTSSEPLVNNSSAMSPARANALEQIITQQNQLMSLQLQLLSGHRNPRADARVSVPPTDAVAARPSPPMAGPARAAAAQADSHSPTTDVALSSSKTSPAGPATGSAPTSNPTQRERAKVAQLKAPVERFGPYKPVRKGADGGLTEQQRTHLHEFIARFTAKTAGSREHAQKHRQHFADPRGVAGYRRLWKSMVYQISVQRSQGSKLWDVDGNEYIDVAMGFGLNLFGQSPEFVTEALHRQLERGVEVGPQSPLAGEVAQLLCDFARQDRATFCNTGSEAVMAAMRLARTVTGKPLIVFFNKDYHGNFDQVLLRSYRIGGALRTQPAAPGVPQNLADGSLVLDYGSEEALRIIRERSDEIAAVLVEPVQSADPFLQPKAFLKELRRITLENDIALIMDEVISGFRAAPGGAQEWFDVWGDMATYGKILGGGLPIGALAGSAKYMDALDGGVWHYDDHREPAADMTFFAGTFVRHPLALTAAHQILMKIKEDGPELQEKLTARTARLVDSLNQFFESELFPIRVAQFSSLFRFTFPRDLEYPDLLYFHLLDRGIFTRGWSDNCFLSTAHSDEDIERIIAAVKDSCRELQQGGFLPGAASSALPRESAPQQLVEAAPRPTSVFQKRADPLRTSLEAGQNRRSPNGQTPLETRTTSFPLTETQQEILLTSKISPDASCANNEPLKLHLRGVLRVEVLLQAMHQVFRRHEALHVRIDPLRGTQQVGQVVDFPIRHSDLSQLDPDERDRQLHAIERRLASTPFDLLNEPLLRVELVRLSDDEHALIFDGHHIVTDGWSWNIMLVEIAELYSARVAGKDVQLAPAGSFREYVVGNEERRQHASEALDYWLHQYRQLPTPVELPTDHPRPAQQTYRAKTAVHEFSDETFQALKGIATARRVSLFTAALAIYSTLIAKLAGQSDIVVGIRTAGQTLMENHNLVGLCMNVLPLRTQVDAGQSFSELLANTQSQVLEALEHQECTLGRIVRNLKLPRSANRMPLTDIHFNLDRDSADIRFEGLETEVHQTEKSAINHDLFFNLNETRGRLRLYFDFNSDLYHTETIRLWISYFESIIKVVASDEQVTIDDISLLSGQQRRRQLIEWNATQRPYPREVPVFRLFENVAASRPQAEAVCFDSRWLTYAALNRRANQLARYLQSEGVAEGSYVGIYLRRSQETIIAALAVIKAGAAYVPLDPEFPQERLNFMVEDSGLQFIVTEDSLDAGIIAAAAQLVRVTNPAIEQQSGENLTSDVSAEDVAYVIYTSGSTGQPKGVQIPHGALTNFLCSMQHEPGMSAADTLASVTTLSFDIAALELYLPLISGARLVIVSQGDSIDGRRLAEVLNTTGATILQATPATFRLMVESGWRGKKDLTILCGGEAMPASLAKQLLPKCRTLWNMYGPTETTIWSTIKRIDGAAGSITVGRPIANTQIFILDEKHRPVPIGVEGRLHIGGDGLAIGYLNRPELTTEKFFKLNIPGLEACRVYDTGDQARYLASGEIDFLGRVDHQVKISGYRIELGEIETVVERHPAVAQSIVSVHQDASGHKQLICYVRTHSQESCNAELRQYLKDALPPYMLPASIEFLKEFPLTPNGKVDRRALPAPRFQQGASNALAPRFARDALEQQLLDIWRRVLGHKQIGLDDNFFDLGGHSLAAARMMSEIEQVHGQQLPLAILLQHGTIASLAEQIRARDWQSTWRSLVSIRPGGSEPPLFCVHAAGGNVLLYRELAKHLSDARPVYGLQSAALGSDRPQASRVEDIAAEYVAEIRKVQSEGPYHLCGYCLGGTIAYEIAQQLSRAGQQLGVLALLDTHSRWHQPAWWTRAYVAWQQISFHTANVFLSGPKGVRAFLSEKLSEAARRGRRRSAVLHSQIAYRLRLRKEPPLPLLETYFDHITEEYIPTPYRHELLVFKPCKAYVGYTDEFLGWKDLAPEVEVVQLPVYPAGMLLKPFVGKLAEYLDEHLSRCSASSLGWSGSQNGTAGGANQVEHAVATQGV